MDPHASRTRNTVGAVANATALAVVYGYQAVLSPFAGGACRFTPSCSAYAVEAIRLHGAARGLWLALNRVARCHPWGGFGHDPVPQTVSRSGQAVLGDRSLES
jgi:uncharacterized protein